MIPNISKKGKQTGEKKEVTPDVIDSAAQEIIDSANEILDMYGIDGSVVNLELGLLPKETRGKHKNGKYKTSFSDNEDYNLSVNYNRTGKPKTKRNGWK